MMMMVCGVIPSQPQNFGSSSLQLREGEEIGTFYLPTTVPVWIHVCILQMREKEQINEFSSLFNERQ